MRARTSPAFGSAYPLTVKVNARRYESYRDGNRTVSRYFEQEDAVIKHAVSVARKQGRNVEVLRYYLDGETGRSLHAEQAFDGSSEWNLWLHGKIRLASPDSDALTSTYVWLEDDQESQVASRVQAGLAEWMAPLRQHLKAFQALNPLKQLCSPSLWPSRFEPSAADQRKISDLMSEVYQTAQASSRMTLTSQVQVQWTLGGRETDVTEIPKR